MNTGQSKRNIMNWVGTNFKTKISRPCIGILWIDGKNIQLGLPMLFSLTVGLLNRYVRLLNLFFKKLQLKSIQ